jgi:hypothetical protein
MMMYRGLGRLRILLSGRILGNELNLHLLGNELDLHLLDRFHLNLLDRSELPSLDPLLVHPPLDHLPIDQFLCDQLLSELLQADRMPLLVNWTIPPLLELHAIEERLDLHRRSHPSNPPLLYPMLVYLPLRAFNRPTTLLLFSHGDDGPRVLVHADLSLRNQRLDL